ncbi:glutathione S-transferase family protein [Chitinimonas viridis]|uniref:Glutathione S-transferase family protein n=1 Tax=Chitinimonas viridis TaxID=664880 RepID=A0ABT8B8U0_9NEIS|nr:glutathione S-transferase family protein [Chitinimonas viridis]MDN3578041.1 glutathione S-transferase family protein [Chitinimonas viridis]
MYTLYGCKGCGSAAIEAALTLVGAPYQYIEAEPWSGGPAVDELRRLNPLAQVPTLLTPDGTVLTESVAILIWLSEQYPASHLLPTDATARATVLRWLVYLTANAYAAIGIGDFPERWIAGEAEQGSLKAFARARLEDYWRTLERQLGDTPFLFTQQLTVLDLLAATMSHWRPGRDWFQQECPKLTAALQSTLSHTALAPIWIRNFTA